MRIAFRAAALAALLAAAGCGVWQANKASQAVEITPLNAFSGEPVMRPANGPGYVDGEPQDLRTR